MQPSCLGSLCLAPAILHNTDPGWQELGDGSPIQTSSCLPSSHNVPFITPCLLRTATWSTPLGVAPCHPVSKITYPKFNTQHGCANLAAVSHEGFGPQKRGFTNCAAHHTSQGAARKPHGAVAWRRTTHAANDRHATGVDWITSPLLHVTQPIP